MDDVLIVGAGPTGLMLACWLAASGIRARVVDPKAGPTQETRAVAVQARTLELWEILGVAERALERGRRGEAANFWVDGRRAARMPIGEIGKGLSPYPFILLLGQDETERLLYERLKELGGEVEWGVGVDAVEGHRVTFSGKEGRGKRGEGAESSSLLFPLPSSRSEYRFILGCDGARSIVRKAAGLEFAGGTYDARFCVADVVATGGVFAEELNIALFGDRFLAFFPLKEENRYRLVGLLDPMLDPEAATVEDIKPEVERLMRTRLDGVRWFSSYRVHHRVVESFRRGPLFLVGDAAHVHSPVGGQGMNTGLGDAANLAWKLAEVLRRGADERLLDTYEAERRPFARWLVANTDRAFELVVRQTPLARFARLRLAPRLMPLLFRVPAIRRLAFRTVSQIGISYRKGPLAGSGGGDRMPPVAGARPDRWRLFGPAEAAGWCEERGIDLVAREGKVLLVRPDGYVGMSMARFEKGALDGYRSRCGAGGTPAPHLLR